MAQDNTPAIVMYKGPQEDGYSIPFDKGYYGEVKVAFVRRGLTDYEYMPTTYTVDGALYAWEISTGVYYYTKSATPAVDATVYNSGNQEISGVKVVSTQDASASFSDGKTGIRSNKKDIHSHALLFWTGEPLGDDDWICIVRETVKKQPYSYPNNQKHIEGALDNLSRQIQELKAQSDVSLKVDPTFVQDPAKMNPIDWLNTIVRSTDTTARGLRYRNFWLEYSTDDPNKAESDKSWTKLLNTTNITSVREWYDEDNKVYIPQYSMDGGTTWKSLAATADTYTKTEVDNKFAVANAQIDANADAIQKTREDFINADSEIHQILNNHAENLTTLHNDVDDLGDQVAEIESKIPESASATNQLATKADLANVDLDGYVKKSGDTMTGDLVLDGHDAPSFGPEIKFVGLGANPSNGHEFMTTISTTRGSGFSIKEYFDGDLRNVLGFYDGFWGYSYINDKMLNSGGSLYPWKTTFTKALNAGNKVVGDVTSEFSGDLIVPTEGGTLARLEDVATKQDKLTAGDNIIISNNVISATGAGGGAGFDIVVVQELPATGQKGIIYLLAKDGTAPDVYDEYVWITATQTFELIGTTQVDLSDYVKNTDYATDAKAGIIRPSEDLATNVNTYGYLRASIQTLEQYNSASDSSFIGKRTLENIKEDLVARATENAVNTQNLTVGSGEGTLYIGDVAGTATIATNNGLDIVAKTKFDTAPTTDDNTTYANALDVSLMRKAQVATAIADAVAKIDALPDQTGNAGKVLMTDGDKASWQDAPAGGTKVIIKRYE